MPRTLSLPRISYTCAGKDGPRVLLIMGYGMRGEVWRAQVEGLSEHCQVIHFDHRGIGASDPVGVSLSMRDMAGDAFRVLDEVGWLDGIHLVGVSMGGMIAQEMALRAAQRFASLGLLATHAGGPGAVMPTAAGALQFMRMRMGSRKARSAALARLLYPESYLANGESKAVHERMKRQLGSVPAPLTIRRQFAAICKHDTRRRLAGLSVPTLIIKPELDILVRPSCSDELKRRIPRATMVSFPNSGHGVIFQDAEEINDTLLRHFRTEEP